VPHADSSLLGLLSFKMFDIPRLYTSACSYSVQTVRLYPILMSILLYHFKQLTQCISEAERIEAKLNSSKNKGSTKEKEEEQLAQPTAVPQQLQGQLRLSEFCNLNDVDQ
jgi:hypothetical protein